MNKSLRITFLFAFLTILCSSAKTSGLPSKVEYAEIPERKYKEAYSDFSKHNIVTVPYSISDSLEHSLIHKIFEIDRYLSDTFAGIGSKESHEFFHSIYSIEYTPEILMIKFVTPVSSYSYLASQDKYGHWTVSPTRIPSAPISISSAGLIAGIKENIDEFFIDIQFYKIMPDLSVKEISMFNNAMDNAPCRISYSDNDCFWKGNTLFIKGIRLPNDKEKEKVIFFKLTLNDIP